MSRFYKMSGFILAPKASFHTLGCKLNFAETSEIEKILEKRGILKATGEEVPDFCIVNTCSVTSVADKKAKNLIRGLARKYPEAAIIVTGCYAQLKPDEVKSLPGVRLVLGTDEKLKIGDFVSNLLEQDCPSVNVTQMKDIKEFHGACQRGDRTRYFLKVQDGCNYFCTYCTIPLARGRSRSGYIDDMVALARNAAAEGGKEIVLTGVNVGEFGKDHGESFFDLLRALDKVEGIERFRISSIEPNLLSEDIISWIASESGKFMPHFHIPLQSGSDKVLRLMNRKYDTSLFASRIDLIRRLIPDAFIGVDIIAGARGETEEEWLKAFDFISSLEISRLHVFPYSERAGTRALSLEDPVPSVIKHQRAHLLGLVSERKLHDFMSSHLSSKRPVLWESKIKDGRMQGFSDNYLRVEADFVDSLINNVSLASLESIDSKNPDVILATVLTDGK